MTGETLRARLEAIVAMDHDLTRTADQHMAQAIEHAVAALAILDAANYTRRDGWPTTRYAYIRDPGHPHDAPVDATAREPAGDQVDG